MPRYFPKSLEPIFSNKKCLNINSPKSTLKQTEKRNPTTSNILYLSTSINAKSNQYSQSDLSLISTPKSSPRTKTIINSI